MNDVMISFSAGSSTFGLRLGQLLQWLRGVSHLDSHVLTQFFPGSCRVEGGAAPAWCSCLVEEQRLVSRFHLATHGW